MEKRSRMRKAALLACCVLFISAGSSWVAAQGDGGRLRSGPVLYEEHCARCHGLTGKGDGPDGKRLIVPPANFQSLRSRAKTDFELFTTIAYGVAYSPMHGWRGRLTDEEMLEAISHIRALAPFYPAF
jgi:cytochrome c oxidase cbb3-type subunit 3